MVDNFISIFSIFISWFPYIVFNIDVLILQFILLYLLNLMLNSKNIYYILLYIFIEIFFLGIFLAFIQLELFTGFLWVVECTIIFIFLIFLFYTNFKGYINNFNTNFFFFNKYLYIITFFFINILYIYNLENYIFEEFYIFLFWDDFYESYHNTNANDFTLLLISYFLTNSFQFILIGILLLLGSVVCVNLHKVNKNKRIASYDNFFTFFNFFKDSVNFSFIRKQNLNNQNISTPSTKIFKKKI